jgi:hypothetical protein
MLKWYFAQTKEKVWSGNAFNSRAEQFYRRIDWSEVGTPRTKGFIFEMKYKYWTTSPNS